VTFECWPRFSDGQQFPGWPITVRSADNDGRTPQAWLPELIVDGARDPVVQVIAEHDGEILYSIRVRGTRFQPHVYSPGSFTINVGRNRPDGVSLEGLKASGEKSAAGTRTVKL
jgi:hypothetical protein